MYLWDLNLDDIPLGWKETYGDALKNYPDGKFVIIESDNDKKYRFWAHPVQFHDLIKHTFEKLKNEAKCLISNKDKYELRDFMNRIVHLDVGLYHLLFMWSLESSLTADPNAFNSFEYFRDEKYYNYYHYTGRPWTEWEEKYQPLRVLDI